MTLDQEEEEEEEMERRAAPPTGFQIGWIYSLNVFGESQSSKHNVKTRYLEIININRLAGDRARHTEFETPRTNGT